MAATTKKQLVPKLRFKEFDGEWERKLLGDLNESIKSGKNNKSDNGCYSLYGSTGIIGRTSEYSYNGKYILIARVGANAGKINRIDGQFGVSDNTIVLDVKISTKIDFLYFTLVRYNLNRLVFGSGQPLITGGQLQVLKLNLPTLPEQEKIASFLGSVDQKIALLQQKKKALELYKKGVMQQLFTSPLERGQRGVSALRFKDPNGNNYPDWETKKLGEVGSKVNKKNKDNSCNYVLTNSATQGIVSQSDYFERDIANQNNLQGYCVVEVNDFVYNPRISAHAPVGPIKRNKLKEGVMSPLYTVFRLKEVDLIYMEYFFLTIVWHKYLNSVANFGARHDRMNISQQDFFKMPIPIPCKEEQEKIANFLSAIDVKIEHCTSQLKKTQEFKKGLLQQMFV